MILSVFVLSGCGTKTPTQSIIDSGIQQIERAEQIIKNTETLAQCKENAINSLQTGKESLISAAESCKAEISNLKADLVRWKTYFWLLIFGIGAIIYFGIINKLRKGII